MSSLFEEADFIIAQESNLQNENTKLNQLKQILRQNPKPTAKIQRFDHTADFVEFDKPEYQTINLESNTKKEKKDSFTTPEQCEDYYKQTLNKVLYYIPPWLTPSIQFNLSQIKCKGDLDVMHQMYHDEILSFTKWAEVDSKGAEMAQRTALFDRIKYQVKTVFPKAEVVMFGSTPSEFALKGSDIDILVFYPSIKFTVLCDKIQERLLRVKAFEYVERIFASVPILKIRDNKTGLCVDVAFNRDDGIFGCTLAVLQAKLFPELRPLYFVVKAFLRERGLDQTRKGGVCSFMIINMVVYYLQTQYKEKHMRKMLHLHLYDFFKLYGIQNNTREVAVSVRAGGFTFFKNDAGLGKEGRIDGKLGVESPIMVLDDVGCGAFAYTQVKKHFKLAFELMQSRGFLSESLLKLIINPEMFQQTMEE